MEVRAVEVGAVLGKLARRPDPDQEFSRGKQFIAHRLPLSSVTITLRAFLVMLASVAS